jgi:hypothetical protein
VLRIHLVHIKLFLQTNSVIAVKYLPRVFGKVKFQSRLICVSFKHIPTSLHCCHIRNISTVDRHHLAPGDMNSKYLLLKIRLFIQKQLEGNTFHRQHPLLYVCPFPCQSSEYTQGINKHVVKRLRVGWGGGAICD